MRVSGTAPNSAALTTGATILSTAPGGWVCVSLPLHPSRDIVYYVNGIRVSGGLVYG